jgi:hypothetical protein
VEKQSQESLDHDSGFFISKEYTYSNEPIVKAVVLVPPDDGNLKLVDGNEILIYSHLVEEVSVDDEILEIVPENAVIGVFLRKTFV